MFEKNLPEIFHGKCQILNYKIDRTLRRKNNQQATTQKKK